MPHAPSSLVKGAMDILSYLYLEAVVPLQRMMTQMNGKTIDDILTALHKLSQNVEMITGNSLSVAKNITEIKSTNSTTKRRHQIKKARPFEVTR